MTVSDIEGSEFPFVYGGRRVHHPMQYLGLAALYPPAFDQICAQIRRVDPVAHAEQMERQAQTAVQASRNGKPYAVTQDGIAIVELNGLMTKWGSSFDVGTVEVRRQMRMAVRDQDVRGILLHVDSPGGTVAGTDDLAADVAEAAAQKLTWAYVEDMAASAAYYVASQASQAFANPSAVVGCIGTYMVVEDWSQFFSDAGVKVHIMRSGEFKGAGVMGSEITEAQIAEWQRWVEAAAEMFVASVARGRGTERKAVLQWSDGRVWSAAEATKMGLIDGVRALDRVIADMARRVKSGGGRKESSMSTTKAESTVTDANAAGGEVAVQTGSSAQPDGVAPSKTKGGAASQASPAASLEELEAAMPKASDAFKVAALKGRMTLQQAQQAYVAEMERQVEAANKAAADAQAQVKAPAAGTGGGYPHSSRLTAEDPGCVQATNAGAPHPFEAAVDALVAKGENRIIAIRRVAAAQPELHREYVDGYQAAHPKRQRAAV